MRVEDSPGNKLSYLRSLSECLRETDVGALEQRRVARDIKRQQPFHLRIEVLIRKRIPGELVAQEAADYFFCVGDGVYGHSQSPRRLDLTALYFWRRLLGFSGIVYATRPASMRSVSALRKDDVTDL